MVKSTFEWTVKAGLPPINSQCCTSVVLPLTESPSHCLLSLYFMVVFHKLKSVLTFNSPLPKNVSVHSSMWTACRFIGKCWIFLTSILQFSKSNEPVLSGENLPSFANVMVPIPEGAKLDPPAKSIHPSTIMVPSFHSIIARSFHVYTANNNFLNEQKSVEISPVNIFHRFSPEILR